MTRSLNFYAPSKKRQRPEARLQKALVQILRLNAEPGVLWFSIPNEGRRSVVTGAELKAMGLRPGVADLCFVIEGRAHFLELKAERGRLTEAQMDFHADVVAAGASWFVAYSLDGAVRLLADWGVLKGAKVAA